MTPEAIRSLMNREPFSPFRVHMVDGRAIKVLEREYIAISPTGKTFVVGQEDGALVLLDVAGVVSLEVPIRTSRRSSRRRT